VIRGGADPITSPNDIVGAAVLVADDDRDIRTMVRTLLEIDGIQTLEAADGTEAWEMIVRHRPAVVITDVSMRGYTGLDLCRKVKADRLASTRVIVYTAGMASEAESQLAGCDAYFLKTDSVARLRETARSLATR
jgi:CheY-like chemotaxis protein